MIRCRELASLLGDFLSEDLPAAQRRRVADHLGWCPACSADLELHQRLIRATRDLPDAPVPPRLLERLTAALRSPGLHGDSGPATEDCGAPPSPGGPDPSSPD
jgi:anti-sigma factor RsiW